MTVTRGQVNRGVWPGQSAWGWGGCLAPPPVKFAGRLTVKFYGLFSTVADRREQPDVAALGLARRGLGDTVENSPGTALQKGVVACLGGAQLAHFKGVFVLLAGFQGGVVVCASCWRTVVLGVGEEKRSDFFSGGDRVTP